MLFRGVVTPFLLLVELVTGAAITKRRETCDTVNDGYQCHTRISHSWGQYAPYYAVEGNIPNDVPDTCKVTFVNVLSRHGARDPTAAQTAKLNATIAKIQKQTTSYSKKYAFIKDFTYNLGADQLTWFGENEMVNSGLYFVKRYKALSLANDAFIRSSGEDRVIESALNWTQGFIAAKKSAGGNPASPYATPVVIPEGETVNNTLDHNLCTAFEDGPYANYGKSAQAKWTNVFIPPLIERVNKNLIGANLVAAEVINLMDLCPFITVSYDKGDPLSPFCDLFDNAEFAQYEYYQDVGKYYGYGPGNPLGPTQGVGYTNELIARLTGKPVNDHTSTNSTLDSNPATFPLGKKIYADFSHDNSMISIFSAMGLFEGVEMLSNTTMSDTSVYSNSKLVSFGSRMYVEKLLCDGESEEKVRVLVNDKVMSLPLCEKGEAGICTLSDFVNSLTFAMNGGDWNQCF